MITVMITISDGKVSEPSKNEPNQNPGFAKNRIEPGPYVYRTRTEHGLKILDSFPSLIKTIYKAQIRRGYKCAEAVNARIRTDCKAITGRLVEAFNVYCKRISKQY